MSVARKRTRELSLWDLRNVIFDREFASTGLSRLERLCKNTSLKADEVQKVINELRLTNTDMAGRVFTEIVHEQLTNFGGYGYDFSTSCEGIVKEIANQRRRFVY